MPNLSIPVTKMCQMAVIVFAIPVTGIDNFPIQNMLRIPPTAMLVGTPKNFLNGSHTNITVGGAIFPQHIKGAEWPY